LARLPDARSVVVSLACGAALVAVARGTDLFGLHNVWMRLLAGGVLFVLLYALPVLALDPKLRQMMRALRSRLD